MPANQCLSCSLWWQGNGRISGFWARNREVIANRGIGTTRQRRSRCAAVVGKSAGHDLGKCDKSRRHNPSQQTSISLKIHCAPTDHNQLKPHVLTTSPWPSTITCIPVSVHGPKEKGGSHCGYIGILPTLQLEAASVRFLFKVARVGHLNGRNM
jgi:hypothetical protein